jgi:hypothetical protein
VPEAVLAAGSRLLREHAAELLAAGPPGTPLPETRYVALGASFLNGSTVPCCPQPSDYFIFDRYAKPMAITMAGITNAKMFQTPIENRTT